jgi:hypothetical protein
MALLWMKFFTRKGGSLSKLRRPQGAY